MHDVGHYIVVAENEAGKDQTHCQVFVTQTANIDQTPIVNPDAFRFLEHPQKQKPRPDEQEKMIPPKVIVPLSNTRLEEGRPLQLACKIEGLPKPKVKNPFPTTFHFHFLRISHK